MMEVKIKVYQIIRELALYLEKSTGKEEQILAGILFAITGAIISGTTADLFQWIIFYEKKEVIRLKAEKEGG